ncbi:MAG TPA: secretin N-terminal domain-containing protein [Longimicrobium sp.]|jgi:general secretion pathway protein D|uniref:type II secretion system protein GspD n=1 Tax=Longimicrobium sp. TaxID=2029185 RepID=UPI002ED80722
MAVTHIVRVLLLALLCLAAPPLRAQPLVSEGAQGVNVNLVEVELRAAVQALSQYLDRPVMFGSIGNQRVTFTSPRPVPRADIPGLLRTLLAGQGYVMEEGQSGSYEIRATGAQPGGQGQVPPPYPGPREGGGTSLASANGMELFVIRLRHARTADVAATVNALYGRGGALGEIGARRGTLNDQLNQNRVAPYGEQGPVATAAAPSGDLQGNVVIVPDSRTNSLLVRASAADFALIRAAVEQVDVRPLQVMIQATVAYVRRDFTLGYGIQATVGDVAVNGSDNTTVGGSTVSGGLGDLVVRALNLGGIDLDLVLRAGESRSNVVIMDRPLLLAANNEEAEIVVGEQRPFVQVQRSTDGGVLDEVVQYKDVGTSLRVLPTISADGYVQLAVTQEVNSATDAEAGGGINAPVISTRAIQTQLLVRDGHTAVLGGLAGTQRDRTSGGIPFLSNLPLIGGVFGRRQWRNNDFELFVFITPHVIYSDDDLDDAATDVRRNRPAIRRATDRLRPMVGGDVPDDAASDVPAPDSVPQPVPQP